MIREYLRRRIFHDRLETIVFLAAYILLWALTFWMGKNTDTIGLGIQTLVPMLVIAIMTFALVMKYIPMLRYGCARTAASMKRYGSLDRMISQIEEKINNKNYLHFYVDEKKKHLLFIDREEMLCVSSQLSGYCATKDALWCYYWDGGAKNGHVQLFVWGEKRINSFQSFMPKEDAFKILAIIEQHSDALMEYRNDLKDVRRTSYAAFVKTVKQMKENKG